MMPQPASRTGEKDLFAFYHHSGGIQAILEVPEEEAAADGAAAGDPELRILEALARVDPTDFLYLRLLSDLYTKAGRVRDGLRVDRALATLYPNEPTIFYNLACSWSLLADIEEALSAFERALELGWHDFEFARKDADLENLRRDPRFEALLAQYEGAGGNA